MFGAYCEEGETFMKKLCRIGCLCVCLLLLMAPLAHARSYQYNEWDEAVPAPDGYTCTQVLRGDLVASGQNWELADLFVGEDGNLYALDASGGKLHIFNRDLRYIETIGLTENGEEYFASGVGGVFVDGVGEKRVFYITDPANSQVLIADATGAIIRKLGRPDTDLIDENAIYDPTKIQMDDNGNLYIQAPGIYMGALVLSVPDDYRFKTFIASNPIETTFSVMMDYLWKQILNDEQVDRMAVYVPVAFSNFTLDDEGYLYTVTNKNTNADSINEIKKFNTNSHNILPDQKYGDLEVGYVDFKFVGSSFSDLVVTETGNIVAVDGNLCRIHVFNQQGDRLFSFGERGKTGQALDTPVAVEAIGDTIYVLDRNKATLFKYEPTAYGRTLLEADLLQGQGEYLKAAPHWEQVLERNSGSILALNGLGKAALEEKQYEAALEYFRKAGSREEYSQAFGLYRSVKLQYFFPVIFIIMIVGFVGLLVADRYLKVKRAVFVDPAQKTFFGKVRYTLFHPCDGGFVFARRTAPRSCLLFGVGVAVAWFVLSVLDWQYAGFLFNTNDTESFEVVIHILKTFGLYLLWILSSWFVSNLMDSSASLHAMVAITSEALLPYILSVLIHTLMSNVFTQDEAVFLYAVQVVLILWAVVILLGGMKEAHELSLSKTILFTVFTVLGMAFIIFLLLLVISLFQDVLVFAAQVWKEFIKML